ncbi:MurR/RpiR family transcriptional regulator [Faecalicatena faecalis]|nr:MurR/RpiR family transcriptional regulator [Faecalicatena faecalis]
MRNMYPQMNAAMKKIADYIIANSEDASREGAHMMAQKSGVSDASVSRFVQIMGYENYKLFQLALVSSLSEKPERKTGNTWMQYSGQMDGNNTKDVCRTIFQRSIQMLEDTWKNLDISGIENVTKLISEAERIILLSVGRSKVTTEALFSRLYRLGYNVQVFNDPHEQVIITSLVREHDLVIAVSNFGVSKSVVEGVLRANKNGATTVGITSVAQSPLARASKYCIFSAYDYEAGEMGKYYEPSCENIPQVTVMDCIYMLLAMQDEKRTCDVYETISEELKSEHIKK